MFLSLLVSVHYANFKVMNDSWDHLFFVGQTYEQVYIEPGLIWHIFTSASALHLSILVYAAAAVVSLGPAIFHLSLLHAACAKMWFSSVRP